MTTLVLWDIDRTLIDLSPVGGDWVRRALRIATGIEATALPETSGRTDTWIVRELLVAHGIAPSEESMRAVFAALVGLVAEERAGLAGLGRALPGAEDALRALAERPDVRQTLVTGNLREIAEHKLAAFDLLHHLDPDIGGYGAISAHRPDLVAEAIRLAEAAHGPAAAVIVIGDTPHDVQAAREHGATAVGVATGRFDAERLAAAGAHVVLPDLVDTAAVVALLGAGSAI